MNEVYFNGIYQDFFDAILSGDRKKASLIAQHCIANDSMLNVYELLLKRVLYHIGDWYLLSKISIGSVHLSSAIVDSVLHELQEKIVTENKNGRKVITTCIENEYHQIGLKMVSHLFEKNGWFTYYLGPNMPSNEILSFAKIVKPDIIAISMSVFKQLNGLDYLIKILRKEFPDMPILIGGQAVSKSVDISLLAPKIFYIPDLLVLEDYLHNIQ